MPRTFAAPRPCGKPLKVTDSLRQFRNVRRTSSPFFIPILPENNETGLSEVREACILLLTISQTSLNRVTPRVCLLLAMCAGANVAALWPSATFGAGARARPCPTPAATITTAAQPEEVEGPDNHPPTGFTNLLADDSLALWQGRFISPLVEMRLGPLRRHRFQRLANMDMAVHWRVSKGVLVYDGKGKSIRTRRSYRNFELYLDWKVSKGGVSAVYLRKSPAVKIWDTSLEDLGAEVGSGGLFYNRTHPSKPDVKADNAVGTWNRFYIKMVDDRVTVKLNGQLVVDNVVLENHWVADSPVFPTGEIELEGTGTPLEFKNIYLRELP